MRSRSRNDEADPARPRAAAERHAERRAESRAANRDERTRIAPLGPRKGLTDPRGSGRENLRLAQEAAEQRRIWAIDKLSSAEIAALETVARRDAGEGDPAAVERRYDEYLDQDRDEAMNAKRVAYARSRGILDGLPDVVGRPDTIYPRAQWLRERDLGRAALMGIRGDEVIEQLRRLTDPQQIEEHAARFAPEWEAFDRSRLPSRNR